MKHIILIIFIKILLIIILKNNKLEKWGIGLQKSLFSYDPDVYDNERMMTQEKILQKNSLDPNEFDFYNYLNEVEDNTIDYAGENDDEDYY